MDAFLSRMPGTILCLGAPVVVTRVTLLGAGTLQRTQEFAEFVGGVEVRIQEPGWETASRCLSNHQGQPSSTISAMIPLHMMAETVGGGPESKRSEI